jgi:hypothetical protein
MLILLPSLLLFVAVVALLIVQWRRPSFGIGWLIAASATFIVWILLIVFRLRSPQIVVLFRWQSLDAFPFYPALVLDRISWPYAFGLVTILFALILTASARVQHQTNPIAWAGSISITAVGLFAVFAGNPFTLTMAWMALDLIELLVFIVSLKREDGLLRSILGFAGRLTGTFILIWVVAVGKMVSPRFDFGNLPQYGGLLLLLAAGLRLGVLPITLPFVQEPNLRRGIGNTIRMVTAISSLVLLARLPFEVVPAAWAPFLLAFTALAVLYGAVMWLLAADELFGRPYWMISLAGLAMICLIRGHPGASLAWGSTMIFSGSMLFLFSARDKGLRFVPAFGLLGLSGIPFSLAASGWHGLVSSTNFLEDAWIFVAHLLLMLGYIRHAWRKGDSLALVESWGQFTYPLGLVLLVAASVLYAIWGWPGSLTTANWWAGTSIVLVASLVVVLRYRKVAFYRPIVWPEIGRLKNAIQRVFAWIDALLRLEWLYRAVEFGYKGVRWLLQFIATILEGDGGILWTILLFVLIVSFLVREVPK